MCFRIDIYIEVPTIRHVRATTRGHWVCSATPQCHASKSNVSAITTTSSWNLQVWIKLLKDKIFADSLLSFGRKFHLCVP